MLQRKANYTHVYKSLTKPGPSAIQEVASDLHATTEVDFGSGIRQTDGQVQFKYTESTKASVGGGKLGVPERFTISIPCFIGTDKVSMEALLRFRVNSGKLKFFYTLVRPEEVIRKAFLEARNEISKSLKATIINGSIG